MLLRVIKLTNPISLSLQGSECVRTQHANNWENKYLRKGQTAGHLCVLLTFSNEFVTIFHWAGNFSRRQRGGRVLGILQRKTAKKKTKKTWLSEAYFLCVSFHVLNLNILTSKNIIINQILFSKSQVETHLGLYHPKGRRYRPNCSFMIIFCIILIKKENTALWKTNKGTFHWLESEKPLMLEKKLSN